MREFHETPRLDKKLGLFPPAAKIEFAPIIWPVPELRATPDVSNVTVTPLGVLLRKDRSSSPDVSESAVMLPDRLMFSISVVSLAAPMVMSPVAERLPPVATVS